MSDDDLRALLTRAVEQLRSATDLTSDEIIGLPALPPSLRVPETCYSLGVLAGAAAALRATRREMLDDFDLLIAPVRPSQR